MECLQLRSPPGPFHYLISEQAKSFVALQELQNEVGALLEFRDLVIETFPNLRSKMPPSTPASGTRRDWEPGVRVRRKLAGGGGDAARAKPQPSVQDSGFSTETSCKDAHSASASASRSRPLEDELWALLDVIQRKGVRVRDEAELLRGELDERHSGDTAEESFARALSGTGGCSNCVDLQRLRLERDALLARAAQLEASAARSPAPPPATPLGRLDAALDTPSRPPRVATPDPKKFAAILLESNPVELQRQLLTSTVQNQVFVERLRLAAAQRTLLLERLERARDLNEDLKFRLEEKSIELEGALARMRQLESRRRSPPRSHSSMRDMLPLPLPPATPPPRDSDEESRIGETPRRRPSRIPLHTAHKPPAPRPPSAHSSRSGASVRSSTTVRSSRKDKTALPVRTSPAQDKSASLSAPERFRASLKAGGGEAWAARAALVAEYLARADRLARGTRQPRQRPLPAELANYSPDNQRPLPAELTNYSPDNLAVEITRSILQDSIDEELWNGKPQQYFESLSCEELDKDCDSDSLAA